MTVDKNGIDSIVAKETYVGIAVANIDLFAIDRAIDDVCVRDGGPVSVFVSKDMFDRLSLYIDHRKDGDYFGFSGAKIFVNDFLESDGFCVMGA